MTEAGDLLMCGRGWNGCLGLGDEEDRATPTLVARAVFDGEAVLMVACGDEHTAALTEGGGVYTFGLGEDGQLGHGDTEDQLAPRRVPAAGFNGERVVMVAAGRMHTAALSEAGHVYTWGDGGVGQLGHDDWNSHRAPRRVEPGRFGGERVVFVAAGGNQTVAVTAGGRLYTWGYGGHGRLGHGDTGNRLVPTLVGAGAFGGSAVVMAACGSFHTLVVTRDGALWACGQGEYGQLGLNDEIVSDADSDDELFAPVLDSDRPSFARVGAGEFGDHVAFGGASVVVAAAGHNHSAAVTEDGALWTWGAGTVPTHVGRQQHPDEDICWVPRVVLWAGQPLGPGGRRIGRWWGLPAEHALAFAMGTHGRLGAGAHAHCSVLAAEPGLVGIIVGMCCGSVRVGGEGMVRLLGGGLGR